jgi:hypothetical protein
VSLRGIIDALVLLCGTYILVTLKFLLVLVVFRGVRQKGSHSILCSFREVYGHEDIMRVWCAFLRALLGCPLHLVVICLNDEWTYGHFCLEYCENGDYNKDRFLDCFVS